VYSVLIVLQAMDAAGKDGTIKHVMSGVNPTGCQVFSFKKPSDEELDHNFLWRHIRALPERGRIGIFSRSYYEDVLVVRVHPELLDNRGCRRASATRRSGRSGTATSTGSSGTSSATARSSSSSSSTSRRPSRSAAYCSGSRTPTSTGSSRPPTSPSASTGTTTAARSRTASRQRARSGRRGTSSRRTTSGPRALVAGIITRAIRSLDLSPPPLTPERQKMRAQARRKLQAQ
jgi:hypothetical protein